ncbi:type IV pilus modification PilV family protein [Pseudomonas matsuisoli]|nr:type II secretion system protein [Pseudomonas matsuisoli]
MTLIELVLTIVIVSIAAVALYTAMASITARSADPMLRQQSLMIADAYLEEIGLAAFMPIANPACTPIRSCYNDARDYNGVWEAPTDANGALINGLSDYRVAVSVTGPTALSGVPMLVIGVTVTDPAGQLLALTGYRACYGETDAAGASVCP